MLNAHLFLCFSPLAQYQLQWLSQLQLCLFPIQFPFPDMVLTTDARPYNWAF